MKEKLANVWFHVWFGIRLFGSMLLLGIAAEAVLRAIARLLHWIGFI